MEGKLEKAKKNVAEEETYIDDDDDWEDSDDEEMETRVDSLKSNIGMSGAPIPEFESTSMTVSQAYVKAYFSNIILGKGKEKEKEKEKETSPSSSKIRKRSAWADPPNMQNQMLVTSSVKCNDCANIISQGSRLYCTYLTQPLREGYPTKHYVNCPYCSVEIVMETEEGESGFKSLVGATEYPVPVDMRNIVIKHAKWACGYESRIKKLP